MMDRLVWTAESAPLYTRDGGPLTAWPVSQAIVDIIEERVHQIFDEGWTHDHDDQEHVDLELGKAAAAYLGHAIIKDTTRRQNEGRGFPPGVWPWHASWWKPKDRRRDLVRAAALIIAQLEQLDRMAAK